MSRRLQRWLDIILALLVIGLVVQVGLAVASGQIAAALVPITFELVVIGALVWYRWRHGWEAALRIGSSNDGRPDLTDRHPVTTGLIVLVIVLVFGVVLVIRLMEIAR